MSRSGNFDRGGAIGVAPGAAEYALVLQAGSALDGKLVVPLADFLLGAEFTRSGMNLEIRGQDGTRVLIRDYFQHDEVADLWTPGGAVLSGELVARLAGPVAEGWAQAAGSPARPIGVVEQVVGEVRAERADGASVLLTEGSSVFQGDVVTTGAGARLGIRFADDTAFAMEGDGRMVLDELVYDAGSGSGSASFSILQGAFVFVTGQIALSDPDRFEVKTPLATIGVRGTVFGGVLGERLDVFFDDGFGFVVNQAGRQDIDEGQNLTVLAANQLPSVPVATPPGLFDQIFTLSLGVLPITPFTPPGRRGDIQDGDQPDQQEATAPTTGFVEATTEAGDATAGGTIIPVVVPVIPPPPPVIPPPPPVIPSPPVTNQGTTSDPFAGTAGPDEITGSAGADNITGLGGDDTLTGIAGNDTIDGGADNDFIDGGGGNDTLDGGAGNDVIVGGTGTDTAIFSGGPADYTFASASGSVIVEGPDGSDTLTGVEFLEFTDGTTAALISSAIELAGGVINIAIVLDTSGSMISSIGFTDVDGNTASVQRIVALKNSTIATLTDLANSGAEDVRVNIVEFNSSALVLGTFDLISGGTPSTGPGSQLEAAINAVNGLNASGGTNFTAGLTAAEEFIGSAHSTRLVHAGFGLGTWTGGFPGTRKRISSMA